MWGAKENEKSNIEPGLQACPTEVERMQGEESLSGGKTRRLVFAMLRFRRRWAVQVEMSAKQSGMLDWMAEESSGVERV